MSSLHRVREELNTYWNSIKSGNYNASPHAVDSSIAAAVKNLGSSVKFIETYGAVGDGKTDDTKAFLAAINASDILRLSPNKKYTVKDTLYLDSNTVILGEGATIKLDSKVSAMHPVIQVEKKSNIHIFDLKIDGNRAVQDGPSGEEDGGRHGIRIVESSNVQLFNSSFNKNATDGIYIGKDDRAVSDVYLWRVKADGNSRQGLSITGASGVYDAFSTYTNTKGLAPGAGIDIEPNPTTKLIEDIWIFGAEVSGNEGIGFLISSWAELATNMNVIASNFYDNLRYDFRVGVHNGKTISNSQFVNNTIGSDFKFGHMSYMEAPGIFKDVLIKDNVIGGDLILFGIAQPSHDITLWSNIVTGRLLGTNMQGVKVVAVDNGAPVAIADTFNIADNLTLKLLASDLLANDKDSDGDNLTVTGVSAAVNGSVSFDIVSGKVTFTPTKGFGGDASFSYSVSDGKGGMAVGKTNVQVSLPPPPLPASDCKQMSLEAKALADGTSWGLGVSITTITLSGKSSKASFDSGGFGVTGGRLDNQIDRVGNLSETLVLNFDKPTENISVKLGRINPTEQNLGEAAEWRAFDHNGKLIKSGILKTVDGVKQADMVYEFDTNASSPVYSLALTAISLGGNAGRNVAGDDSDFSLMGLRFTPVGCTQPVPAPVTVKASVSAGVDNVDQKGTRVIGSNTDLEFGTHAGSQQTGGLNKFSDLHIPASASIASGHVPFTAESTGSSDTDFVLRSKNMLSAKSFPDVSPISSHAYWTETVAWENTIAWSKDEMYRTPDFSNLFDTLVGGNSVDEIDAIGLMIADSGDRSAYAYGPRDKPVELVAGYTLLGSSADSGWTFG